MLDCEGIDFIDSQGSAKMGEILELTKQAGVTLRLARVKPAVRSCSNVTHPGPPAMTRPTEMSTGPWRPRFTQKEAAVRTDDQPGLGWTVVLRRQPARIVEGRVHGYYTDAWELVCCDCGDHPDLDYPDVSPELQWIRGPYTFAALVFTAYGKHVNLYHGQLDSPVRSGRCTTPTAAQLALAKVRERDEHLAAAAD